MTTTERTEALDEADLRAWDWRSELRDQDRPVLWLARKTATGYQTVYRYARGEQTPTLEWLRSAALVLGRVVPRA